MIQILVTKLHKKEKRRFIVQLYISIACIFIICFGIFINKINIIEQEKIARSLIKNYEISRLYSLNQNNDEKASDIIGTITIPSINISYTFFSGTNDELLKISPCRFSGEMPSSKGNLCIAGHNYNDNRFFSKIVLLKINDEIIIKNNSGESFSYYVYNKYEVQSNDNSSTFTNDIYPYELTLITCNNANGNRIIVKAKMET